MKELEKPSPFILSIPPPINDTMETIIELIFQRQYYPAQVLFRTLPPEPPQFIVKYKLLKARIDYELDWDDTAEDSARFLMYSNDPDLGFLNVLQQFIFEEEWGQFEEYMNIAWPFMFTVDVADYGKFLIFCIIFGCFLDKKQVLDLAKNELASLTFDNYEEYHPFLRNVADAIEVLNCMEHRADKITEVISTVISKIIFHA